MLAQIQNAQPAGTASFTMHVMFECQSGDDLLALARAEFARRRLPWFDHYTPIVSGLDCTRAEFEELRGEPQDPLEIQFCRLLPTAATIPKGRSPSFMLVVAGGHIHRG